MKRSLIAVLAIVGLALGAAAEEKAWTNTADLSMTMTSGNSQTDNLALSNKYTRNWSQVQLTFRAKAVRTEATSRTPFYNPVTDAVEVAEATEKTAESYSLALKTKGHLIGKFQWYMNTGWFKDELAGMDQSITIGGGFGYPLIDNETHKLSAEFGFDYTDETPVGGESESFGGVRGYLDYERPLSETASFGAETEVLSNLDNSEDLRVNLDLGVTASLTTKLALKLGYTLKYDGDPVVEADIDGSGKDFIYEETDTVLSMSLVLNM